MAGSPKLFFARTRSMGVHWLRSIGAALTHRFNGSRKRDVRNNPTSHLTRWRAMQVGSGGEPVMFSEILAHMTPVEFGVTELGQPVSFTSKGEVATIRDWIAEKAPTRVQAAFSKVIDISPARDHVVSVRDLDNTALKRLTFQILSRTDPDKQIAAIGVGDYSPQQLFNEIDRGTEIGLRLVNAVKLNALFIETAVMEGKIRLKANTMHHDLPDFDF